VHARRAHVGERGQQRLRLGGPPEEPRIKLDERRAHAAGGERAAGAREDRPLVALRVRFEEHHGEGGGGGGFDGCPPDAATAVPAAAAVAAAAASSSMAAKTPSTVTMDTLRVKTPGLPGDSAAKPPWSLRSALNGMMPHPGASPAAAWTALYTPRWGAAAGDRRDDGKRRVRRRS